jgi:hypothetical protein
MSHILDILSKRKIIPGIKKEQEGGSKTGCGKSSKSVSSGVKESVWQHEDRRSAAEAGLIRKHLWHD